MNEQLKQIGERLRGLRDALDIEAQEVADLCGITLDKYEQIERGEVDITISNLMKIARQYGVSADALIFDEEPHMRSYSVVRKGQGLLLLRDGLGRKHGVGVVRVVPHAYLGNRDVVRLGGGHVLVGQLEVDPVAAGELRRSIAPIVQPLRPLLRRLVRNGLVDADAHGGLP